jgi:hypothetical protein
VKKNPAPRLLADENTSQRLVSACRRLVPRYPIVHIATWQDGSWLGVDDAALLVSCAEAGLVLVAFDRATLPWHASRLLRAGRDHGGIVLFRRIVRSTHYAEQARLLSRFWAAEGHVSAWLNRLVYLPKSVVGG